MHTASIKGTSKEGGHVCKPAVKDKHLRLFFYRKKYIASEKEGRTGKVGRFEETASLRHLILLTMVSGSPLTTAWRLLRWWMEETASRYGG
jgi:hypothetical protein